MAINRKDHESRIKNLEDKQKTTSIQLRFLIVITSFIATQLGLLLFFIIRLFTEKVLGG